MDLFTAFTRGAIQLALSFTGNRKESFIRFDNAFQIPAHWTKMTFQRLMQT